MTGELRIDQRVPVRRFGQPALREPVGIIDDARCGDEHCGAQSTGSLTRGRQLGEIGRQDRIGLCRHEILLRCLWREVVREIGQVERRTLTLVGYHLRHELHRDAGEVFDLGTGLLFEARRDVLEQPLLPRPPELGDPQRLSGKFLLGMCSTRGQTERDGKQEQLSNTGHRGSSLVISSKLGERKGDICPYD
jgi:hypothetical protein